MCGTFPTYCGMQSLKLLASKRNWRSFFSTDVRRQISMRLDSSVSRVSSTRVPNRISLHQWFNPASSTLWSSIIHERSEGSHEEFNELIGKLYFLVDVVLILISCGSFKPQIEMCLDKMVKEEHNWTSVS